MLCDDNNYDDVFVFPFFFFFFFMNGLTDWTLAPKLLKQLGAKKKQKTTSIISLYPSFFWEPQEILVPSLQLLSAYTTGTVRLSERVTLPTFVNTSVGKISASWPAAGWTKHVLLVERWELLGKIRHAPFEHFWEVWPAGWYHLNQE